MSNWYVRDADGAIRGPVSMEAYCEELRESATREERNRIGDDSIGDVRVSTVFLNLDHNHWGGAPILFETMIFGGQWDQWLWRYATEREAREAHAAIVAALTAGTDPTEAVPS